MKIELVTTSDGSHTLSLPEINEQYHSLNGAITESMHVYIKNGFSQSKSQKPVVFEVGFGTGLNALLTALQAEKTKKQTTCFTIEKYPLEKTLVSQLNYGRIISEKARILFEKLHDYEWNRTISISQYFKIHKINNDLKSFVFKNMPTFDVIYYDAFGPDKQPDMWTSEILQKIADHTTTGGIIVTYSAKGDVRRKMKDAGFIMERLPGPPGKKEMLRGIKRESLT